jgi:predicted lipoprotein with Yx(FWY)xxD motif
LKIFLTILKKLPAVLLATCALQASAQAPTKVSDGTLADAAGMTLYVYDRDPVNGGKSACNGACAQNWVPLIVIEGAKEQGDYTIVTRDDGRKQWAYKGRPLYQWTKDQKPGDKTGEGVNKVWHVATP